jgi:type I restriction enzyme S subunit
MSTKEASFKHPWEEVHVDDVATVIVGGTPSTSIREFWGGDIPWMVSGDVYQKRINDVSGRITELGLQASNAKLVSPPAVAVALAGQGKTRGTVALILAEITTNQSVALLKPKSNKLSADYLFYNLEFRYDELRSSSSGEGRAGLSKGLLEQLQIPLPPVEEQIAIAEILATIDRAIGQTEALIAKQRRIKAGLLHDLLTRGIDEHGNLRDSATHRFKESPVGLAPEEWEVSTVGALFTMELGKMLSGASKRGVCPKPYLANRNVQWGRVDVSAVDTMDFFPREQVRYRLQKDDILICEGGEVGRTALWNDELEECYFQKAIHRLRPIDKKITPMFMLYYMQHVVPRGILLNLTTQTSIAHLTQEQLAVSPIVYAPGEEMDAITSVLQQQDDIQNKLEMDLEKLRRLKTGLMQDLLAGSVTVKSLDHDGELMHNGTR